MADLAPGMVMPNTRAYVNILAGSDGVLASVAWESIVTVWNTTTRPMEQLHCFTTDSLHLPDAFISVSDVRVVDRSKIAILVQHSRDDDGHYFTSLVVIKKGGGIWHNKIIASFDRGSLYGMNRLSSDGDWLAFMEAATEEKKVTMWRGDKNGQETVLPSLNEEYFVKDMHMKLPYLILCMNQDFVRGSGLINVYKVMTDNNAKEINADAYLVKSIGLEKEIERFISNKFFLGCDCDRDNYDNDSTVNLIEKALLLDPAVPPEKTEMRQIRMPGNNKNNMNTTSLLSVQDEGYQQGRKIKLLVKNFWNTEREEKLYS